MSNQNNQYVNLGRFFMGLVMIAGGGYLFLNSVQVTQQFSLSYTFYSVSGFNLTTGIILIPFIFGIGMIFYNPENDVGWVLAILSLVLILFGIIASLNLYLRPMSAFELIIILVLFIGGIGVFLSAFRKPKIDHMPNGKDK